MVERCARLPGGWNPIENRTFCALDERSTRDKTMLLVTWWVTWLPEYIEHCDLDPEKKIEGSKGLRVKILDAGAAVVNLDFNADMYFRHLSGDEHFEGDVYKVPLVRKKNQNETNKMSPL